MASPSFARSSVMLLCSNSVQSFLPSTLISQVESLLESHRIDEAISLADQKKKKLETAASVVPDELDELQYVYQRIGFQCLSETLFEDAGRCLLAGNLDPRVLISYFPDLRGDLFSPSDTLDIFTGIADRMPSEISIDSIITANLVLNYSPHLPPDTRSAPPTAELRKILIMTAKDMLQLFLRKSRVNYLSATDANTKRVRQIVDTVLVKLFAETEKTTDLYVLIQESSSEIIIPEIEPTLQKAGQYSALCILYRQRGEDERLIDALAKLVDGEWTDEDVKDPLSEMLSILGRKRDKALTQRWIVWIAKRNADGALMLLTSLHTGKRKERPEDDMTMLQQMMEANPTAGAQFLQYLVLQRRSSHPELHTRLAMSCVDQLLECLEDEATVKLWRAKAASYSSSKSEQSFVSYFASTTPASEYKKVRLKAIIFLQGSSLYDAPQIRDRVLPHRKILSLELAIVDGKLGNHRDALENLVQNLHDATSAEAYCTLGGEVVPGKTAQAIGEQCGLQLWSGLFLPSKSGTKSIAAMRQKTVDEGLKRGLLRTLLEVYMRGGNATADRAAHVLNAQAMNLDVLDVISLVPDEWPVQRLTSFLSRSFRRALHQRHEGLIVKGIAAGQNLEVSDRTWITLREQGAMVEEAEEDDAGGGDEPAVGSLDEKGALAEKLAMHLAENGVDEVEEIRPTRTVSPEEEDQLQ